MEVIILGYLTLFAVLYIPDRASVIWRVTYDDASKPIMGTGYIYQGEGAIPLAHGNMEASHSTRCTVPLYSLGQPLDDLYCGHWLSARPSLIPI